MSDYSRYMVHYLLRTQQLQEMLSSDPDALKQRMGEMSRKVTILRVNEKGLSRRYTLLSESEAMLRKVGGKDTHFIAIS